MSTKGAFAHRRGRLHLFPFGYRFPHTFATLFGMLVYHKAENAKWDVSRDAPVHRHVKKKVFLPE
jgi:hypothetical protein